MPFQRTTAINKLLAMKARRKVVQGGTSAGKTYGIIPCVIDYATKNPRQKITIVAESIPAVKDGAVKIFTDVMMDTNRWVENRWIANPMEYTFANGTGIQFKSFDTVGKAKAAGKRDVLFLNEANHITYEIADALMIRSRQTWIDFNPDNEFWAHTELLKEPNTEFLLLTYQDNEALPPETLEDLNTKLSKAYHNPYGNRKDPANIKSAYWANWCKVYVDGEIGSLQGTVFQFNIVPRIPDEAELIAYGLDWGFTNDPTALVGVYRCNGELYIEELIYRTGMLNSDIAREMERLGISKYRLVVADCAEPKSIAELQARGFANVVPSNKSGDSIRISIDLLQNFPINVTANSLNTIKELRNYRWMTDKSGKPLNEPVGTNDHAIAGVRYVALNCLTTNTGKYSFA